jgi:hypothetical protein
MNLLKRTTRRPMRDIAAGLLGAAVGTAVMYWLDPRSGRRRRELLREQMAHAGQVTGNAMHRTAKELVGRPSTTRRARNGRTVKH